LFKGVEQPDVSPQKLEGKGLYGPPHRIQRKKLSRVTGTKSQFIQESKMGGGRQGQVHELVTDVVLAPKVAKIPFSSSFDPVLSQDKRVWKRTGYMRIHDASQRLEQDHTILLGTFELMTRTPARP